jgi:hypothetical protein
MLPKMERPRSVHTADGGVLLDINHGRMFTLNSTGSVVFQLLERGLSEDQIVKEMVKRFGISTELAKKDLAMFCDSLRRHSLFQRDAIVVPE